MNETQQISLQERTLFTEKFVVPATNYLLDRLDDPQMAVRATAAINLTGLANLIAGQAPSEKLQQLIQKLNALLANHPDLAEETCVRSCVTKLLEMKQVHTNALQWAKTLTK